MRRVAWWLLIAGLTAATLAAASVGGWLFITKSRHPLPVADQAAARQTVVQAANDCTVKVLSYTSGTMDQDFAAARACLTGDFLNYYDTFTKQVVAPAAKQKSLSATAKVARTGVETLIRDSATILVFVNQTTKTKDDPEPKNTASSVRVSLTRVQGKWLISKFNPV